MSWFPPCWMRLRVSNEHAAGFGVWLPLFLLWPVWWLALLVFLVAALVAIALSRSRNFRRAVADTRELHSFASSLRGAQVELRAARGKHLRFSFV